MSSPNPPIAPTPPPRSAVELYAKELVDWVSALGPSIPSAVKSEVFAASAALARAAAMLRDAGWVPGTPLPAQPATTRPSLLGRILWVIGLPLAGAIGAITVHLLTIGTKSN